MSEEKRSLLERCPPKIVDGHFEHICETEEDRDELKAVYDQEAILRVKPKTPLLPGKLIEPMS